MATDPNEFLLYKFPTSKFPTFVKLHAFQIDSNEVNIIVHGVGTLIRVNDPSAGSPTETLLRLLLPLNDQVWSPSRMNTEVSNSAQQSRELTKPFNR